MKVTTEQYATLKLLADDLAIARMAPKHLERYHKIVVQDGGKDRIVEKFSPEGTRAAILVFMIKNIEFGLDAMFGMNIPEVDVKKPPAIEGQATEIDVFTKEALANIPPGKPDSSALNPPHVKIKAKGLKDETPRKEGEYWIDDNGRHWKIIDGKKVQQKKPKVA